MIDLEGHISVANYEASERLKEHLTLRDGGACVFPWCTRPARTHCDRDHLQPHAQGGPTCSCNLAPLCRRHHRAKTHGGWSYRMIEPGAYLWRSPHGYEFMRNHLGTIETTPPESRRPRALCTDTPDPAADASPDPPEH